MVKILLDFLCQQAVQLGKCAAAEYAVPDGLRIYSLAAPQGNVVHDAVFVQLYKVFVVDILHLAGQKRLAVQDGVVELSHQLQRLLLLFFREGQAKVHQHIGGRAEGCRFIVIGQNGIELVKKAVFQEELRLLVREMDGGGTRDDGACREEKAAVFVETLL